MTQTVIPMHSIVDVITNSSTVIYVAGTKSSGKYMHELINTILKESGSDKKSEDLFEFTVAPNFDYWLDNFTENILEEWVDEEDERLAHYNIPADFDDLDWKETEKVARRVFNQAVAEGDTETLEYDNGYDDYIKDNLVMTSKVNDKFTLELTSTIEKIFEIDGGRDG
jgi:hypothetical protein